MDASDPQEKRLTNSTLVNLQIITQFETSNHIDDQVNVENSRERQESMFSSHILR